MGLFKNQEEKLNEKQRKEEKELEKFINRYGLNSLTRDDLEILRRIAGDLSGNGFLKAGMALSFAKAEEQAKVTYLSALVEQNWLIIKLLGDLNSKLSNIENR